MERRKIKKVVMTAAIIVLCIAAMIFVWLGILIYKGMHPRTSSVPDNAVSDDQGEDEYIDTRFYNEFDTYDTDCSEISIVLSDDAYRRLSETINHETSVFPMAEYYALDQALDLYHNTFLDKSKETALLTDGFLDADKLVRVVTKNNRAVTSNGKNTLNNFYKELSSSDITMLCREVADVINKKPVEFDIEEVGNTLEQLTMFQRTGSTANAYVTTELSLIYCPITTNSYETIKEITGGSTENVWGQVIDHEIMHLIQYGASDGKEENGIEASFCRMYNTPDGEKKIPVDSLYTSWLLEAGAELATSKYLDIEPGTYQKKISYVTSYNLSRFFENRGKADDLETMAFKHTLEEVFETLGLESENEKQEFLNFMYSIEITQFDGEDFWEYYESQTEKTLTEEEQTGLRMDIRTDAVKYLTINFFENLINAIYDGKITDLNTAFYLMRIWELDTFNHLNYTQISSLEHAEDFMIWYDQTQNAILTAMAESSSLDPGEMQTRYSEYFLQDDCDLRGINDHMKHSILSARQSYKTEKYSRIHDVAKWIEEF